MRPGFHLRRNSWCVLAPAELRSRDFEEYEGCCENVRHVDAVVRQWKNQELATYGQDATGEYDLLDFGEGFAGLDAIEQGCSKQDQN